MVWNRSLPADATKLRVSQGYVRQNWDAIEFGEVPFDYIQLSEQVANPTRANDTGWVYTKQAASQTELFYQDDRNPASVIQLTSNNRLGSATTAIIGQTYTFNGTYVNTQPNLVSAWARCSGSSSTLLGTPMLVTTNTRGGTGSYTVSTAAVFTSDNFAVSITPKQNSSFRPMSATWLTKTYLGGIATVTLEIRGRDGELKDTDFDIIFFGGVAI